MNSYEILWQDDTMSNLLMQFADLLEDINILHWRYYYELLNQNL